MLPLNTFDHPLLCASRPTCYCNVHYLVHGGSIAKCTKLYVSLSFLALFLIGASSVEAKI